MGKSERGTNGKRSESGIGGLWRAWSRAWRGVQGVRGVRGRDEGVGGARGGKIISFGGGTGGSESESDSGSAVGAGTGTGTTGEEGSMTVLRRAGELSVRARRVAGYWQKDEGRTEPNTDSGRPAIVGDRGKTGLRGEARRGAVAGGVRGNG